MVTLSNLISITIGGLGVRAGLAATTSPSVGLAPEVAAAAFFLVLLLDQTDPRPHWADVDRREHEAPSALCLKAARLRALPPAPLPAPPASFRRLGRS